MNILKRKVAEFREDLSDTMSHIGWMFWGQGCDCGKAWPNLNKPAARIASYLDTLEYDDEYECKQWQGRALYRIGKWFCDAGVWLINGPLVKEYFEVTSNDNRLIDAEVEAMMKGDR